MSTTAYSRQLKPGVSSERSQQPRIMKNLTKIEPKKLGIGLVAGCCLALLTYISLAKLFAIYSPVFESATMTVANSPPSDLTEDALLAQTARQQVGSRSGQNDITVKQGAKRDLPIPDEKLNEDFNIEDTIIASTTTTDTRDPGFPVHDEKNGDDKSRSFQREASKSQGTKIYCDDKSIDEGFPYARPVVCEMNGNIRVNPKSKTMFFINPKPQLQYFDTNGEKKIRPFARKDDFLLPGVIEVTLKSVATDNMAPECTNKYNVPAVVFSVAGYTGNFFHDMTDVLIPLFLTTSQYKGEVQYFVTNYKPWWLQRYQPVLSKLSNYEIINFDEDEGVHCFPHGFLGLFRDRDLIINPHPTRNPSNYSMVHFTKFLRGAYDLKRDRPSILGELSGKKPKMLIINRKGTRKLLNLQEVAALCQKLGFEVTIAEAGSDVRQFADLVNSNDVLLAVHGAGLTNQIFLPTQAVLVQIVPWGKMDWMATNFYGQPARDMQLRYVEYYVSEQETTLIDKYPLDHEVFTNPMGIHAKGWQALADIIMKQDVKVNLTRFRPFLMETLDKLQE